MGFPPTGFESVASVMPPPTTVEVVTRITGINNEGAQHAAPLHSFQPSVLDPPTPSSSPQPWSRCAHAPAAADAPPFPPFHSHFTNALHEALAHLLIPRSLDGREIARHHAIVEPLLDLRPQAPRLGGVARRAHAVTLLGGETPPRPPREQDGKAE